MDPTIAQPQGILARAIGTKPLEERFWAAWNETWGIHDLTSVSINEGNEFGRCAQAVLDDVGAAGARDEARGRVVPRHAGDLVLLPTCRRT